MEECGICTLKQKLITPKPCGHKICFSCYKMLSKCPFCKTRYTIGSLTSKKIVSVEIDTGYDRDNSSSEEETSSDDEEEK